MYCTVALLLSESSTLDVLFEEISISLFSFILICCPQANTDLAVDQCCILTHFKGDILRKTHFLVDFKH